MAKSFGSSQDKDSFGDRTTTPKMTQEYWSLDYKLHLFSTSKK